MPPSPAQKPSRPSDDHDGQTKPYVIVSEIGKGSFATVYKGYHQDTHDHVAIKSVRRDKLKAKLLDNLQSEIQILKALSHRHITKLIEIVHSQSYIYLIIEYCSGGDLTNYIKTRGRVESLEYVPSPGAAPQYYPHPRTGGLAIIAVRSFLRQLARALKFLRRQNLIHRDIKPQNLLLNPAPPDELARGHPLGVPMLKIADFGFARSLPNAMLAETLCGSPLYMAPEILRYEKYDAKADLWSVGAVLYEMAVGKSPFRAHNHIDLLKKIESSKGVRFPDEDSSNKGNGDEIQVVPSDIKQLIRGLLKQKPVERMSFDAFFASEALAKSKFHRPRPPSEEIWPANPPAPEHHSVIPPEVLDPKAMIPPSKFNFRRTSTLKSDAEGAGPALIEEHNTSPPIPRPAEPTVSGPENDPNLPGDADIDGSLRHEYVMVGDSKALEFNRTVEELSSAPRRLSKTNRTSTAHTPLTEINPNTTFPPPPNINAPSLSSSPSSVASRAASNALNKALSIASKKLFGTVSKSSRDNVIPPSTKPLQIITVETQDERDPLEDELLASLEDLAQKTDVLTIWADELFDLVKDIPEKPLRDPDTLTRHETDTDRQIRRRKQVLIDARSNAVICVHVYMRVMGFSQKGINQLRLFQEHRKMLFPNNEFEISEGFDDALSWFKERFVKCHERTTLVKTWLPPNCVLGDPDQIRHGLYDRALFLSSVAARRELFEDSYDPKECEKYYEESLWCLYTLADDLMPRRMSPTTEDDDDLVSTWIKRTKLRLVRCRARMNMNPRERKYDARADVNLSDIPRIPAPWDEPPGP